MPRHPCGVQSGTPVPAPPEEVLGLPDNDRKGGWIPWGPFQGTAHCASWGIDLPRDIQRGGGCVTLALGISGGSNGEVG